MSKAEAFDLSGRPSFGTTLAPLSETATAAPFGYFVKIAGRIEFTITSPISKLPFDLVRAKGLELEKEFGIPFIERKVPSRHRL